MQLIPRPDAAQIKLKGLLAYLPDHEYRKLIAECVAAPPHCGKAIIERKQKEIKAALKKGRR